MGAVKAIIQWKKFTYQLELKRINGNFEKGDHILVKDLNNN